MTYQLLQGCVAALLVGTMLQSAQAAPARADLLARAEQGDAAAQVQLAIQYRDGVGGQADPAEAVRWTQRAVPAAKARQMLGVAYFRGSGVKRDMKMAFGHFQATADEFPIAAFHLGECYYGAQGVEQNVAKALEFWEKAAEMGHGRAAASAAMAYLSGEGLQANPVKGRRMAERAAELMNPSGLVLMGEIHFQAGEIDFKFYGERYAGGSAGHTLNLVGYLVQGDEVLYILCNPAIASPGLSLITREDLGKYWRSDGYSKQANKILARPALVWGKD